MKTLKDFSVASKRVLVRCDFNVPLDKKGEILNDYRIKQAIPTIKYLIENKAKVIIMSHLDPESTGVADKKYSLKKIGEKLSDLLGTPILMETDCVGLEVDNTVNNLEAGKVLLLENLRFYKEETEGDEEFAKKLSYLGDIYVNEAFSVCHRNHASVALVPKFIVDSCAGFLLAKEVENLEKVAKNPAKPMVAIVGGTKVGTKSKFIEKMAEIADLVIISGLLKKEILEKNLKFVNEAKIIGPEDNLGALDIDEKTIKMFEEKIAIAKTILWNGPFGKFEDQEHTKGTLAIAKASVKSGAFSVVGGGETIEFLEKQGMIDQFSYVSTGGGAMLSYLGGEAMPGLEALKK